MKKQIVVLASSLGMVLSLSAFADGKATYDSKCAACHASGAAGAPKVGDSAAWGPLISQGVDALTASAISGKNAMPPKGACADCSDGDIKAAVEYMVSQSK